MAKRVDEIEKFYKPIDYCGKVVNISFWISVVFSLILPNLATFTDNFIIQDIVKILFILTVLIHAIATYINKLYFIPTADSYRRKQLLSNAFDIPIIPEETLGYYNNSIEPSYKRLAVNVLENAFFSNKVCNEMGKKLRIIIPVYFLIWFFIIFHRKSDLNLILILTQIIFSSNILYDWINIEILRYKNKNVFNQLYSLLLQKNNLSTPVDIVRILDIFVYYESSKALASLKQSSKIFFKINHDLSSEWNKVKHKLNLDGTDEIKNNP